ncbi:MAG: hypothetical protein LCH85_05040 [Chloroflexi bacterium]|nr:hypothetical protein [Chloroflexota bacterium]
MLRITILRFLVIMLLLVACGRISLQPVNPTAGPVEYALQQRGNIFGPNAVVQTAKNCWEPQESKPIVMQIEAGSFDLDLAQTRFYLAGPLGQEPQRYYWEPIDPPARLAANGAVFQQAWTPSITQEGVYTLYVEHGGSHQPTGFKFGVGYIINVATLMEIPCVDLPQ